VSGSTKKRKGEFSSESKTEAKASFDPSTLPPSHHKTHDMKAVVVNVPGALEGAQAGPRPPADSDAEVGADADAVRLPGGLPSNRLQVVETDAQLARAFVEQLESGAKSGKVDPARTGKAQSSGATWERDYPTGPRLGKAAQLPELHGEIVDDDTDGGDAADAAATLREAETAPSPGVTPRGALPSSPSTEPWEASDSSLDEPLEAIPSPAAAAAVASTAGSAARSGSSPAVRGEESANGQPIARAIALLALVGIVILVVIGLWPDGEPVESGAPSNAEGARTGVEASGVKTASEVATTTAVSASPIESSASAAPSASAPIAKPPATKKSAPPAAPATVKTAVPAPPTSSTTKPEVF